MEHDYSSYDVTGNHRPHQTYSTITTANNTTADGSASSTTNRGSGARSPPTSHDTYFLNELLPLYRPSSPRREPTPTYYPHFFEAALRPSPSPPPPNFLDTILNPAGLSHNRYSPFGYQFSPPTLRPFYALGDDMPPSTRAHAQAPSRPARLPNGYVDLTATPDSPPQRRKRQSPTAGPSAKRQKRGEDAEATSEGSEGALIEEVDLTNDKQSVHTILQKQREDAVKSQTKPEEKPTTFNNFNCVICMDLPTDLTATACGHLFCHTCLMEALIAGENRAGPGEARRSQCPVCRKFINRSKASDIIPLLLKKGLATQPRKKAAMSPSAVAPKRASKQAQPPTRRSTRRARRSLDDVEWI